MLRSISRPALWCGLAACLVAPARVAVLRPLVARTEAAPQAESGDWIFLGLVAETGGVPAKRLGDAGFVFADAANNGSVVPKVGDRIRLTAVKEIRKTNAQGQRPFERPPVQGDTTGELAPGTVLKVLESGRRPMSKAGDRWQCWVRVER